MSKQNRSRVHQSSEASHLVKAKELVITLSYRNNSINSSESRGRRILLHVVNAIELVTTRREAFNRKMNATNRLDLLISDFYRNPSSTTSDAVSQSTSVERPSRLTFSERDLYPSTVLPSAMTTTVPLPPRRDSSSLKHHRRRHQINQTESHQPLLNSSTLDDLFRALTLECEQYLAATSTYQNKTYGQMLVQPSSKTQTAVESNDDDYENLQSAKAITKTYSPLKTSIEVMSPIKRHVVSITVSSKVSSSQLPSPTKTILPPPLPPPTICHSTEEDNPNLSSSSTNRKRRRRARKHMTASTTSIRSSSSSVERTDRNLEKKPTISKRSFSTDPRCQRSKNPLENSLLSSKQQTRRPHRRDVSLQHFRDPHSSPLSVLLTSTKDTSDFLENCSQRQQRRSRLESLNQKSSTLLDRMHQQFYRPLTSTRNSTKHNNIPVY